MACLGLAFAPELADLARDGREHAIKLLDALNAPEFDLMAAKGIRVSPQVRVEC